MRLLSERRNGVERKKTKGLQLSELDLRPYFLWQVVVVQVLMNVQRSYDVLEDVRLPQTQTAA